MPANERHTMTTKKTLIGLTLEELTAELKAAFNLPAFRAKQIWQWVYQKGVTAFDNMLNLPATLRAQLNETYTVARPAISMVQTSIDGTVKSLLQFEDKNEIETVFIPESDRGTLCISSQVGCTLSCTFCHTGTQVLVRNLTAADILNQILVAKDNLQDWGPVTEGRKLTNVVLMGMGEPLYNYENVKKAMQILMDADGIGFGKRRITLSTSGIIPFIDACAEELGLNLAISLHAVTNELRNQIVPINKKYPLEELLAACRRYAEKTQQRKITFEYVMLKGINDSLADARALVGLIKGIPAKVNLIPFNPWPGSGYECSETAQIKRFAEIVEQAGYMSPVRTPRGKDILAACGQLKSDSERKSKHKVKVVTY
jgi:23S rRNA (adenine2503-C2)-methyltransferase